MHEQIQTQIKDAMKAKDAVRLEVLRGMLSAFTNELVAKGKKPQDILSDEEVMTVIMRLAKQRKDSIDQYTKGGREDLAAEEKEQLAVLEEFLPEMMSREEIEKVVQAKVAEVGTENKGMLMGAIMKELKGKADGMLVKEVVEGL